MAEKEENQDSLKPEELAQLSQKVEQGESLTSEESEKLIKNIPNLKKSYDGLYSRAKTAEESEKKIKEELSKKGAETPPPNPNPQVPQTNTSDLSVNDFLTFKGKGLTDKEVADAVSESERLGIHPRKFVETDTFNAWIEVKRGKEKVVEATPPPSPGVVVDVKTGKLDREKSPSFQEWKGQKGGGFK